MIDVTMRTCESSFKTTWFQCCFLHLGSKPTNVILLPTWFYCCFLHFEETHKCNFFYNSLTHVVLLLLPPIEVGLVVFVKNVLSRWWGANPYKLEFCCYQIINVLQPTKSEYMYWELSHWCKTLLLLADTFSVHTSTKEFLFVIAGTAEALDKKKKVKSKK